MSNFAHTFGHRGYSMMVERPMTESRARQVLGRVWEMVVDAAEMHRAVRHLNRMDDTLLRDIGVSRAEMQDCVYHGRTGLVD